MPNLELTKYYAKQAKNVYDSMSYDDIEYITKFERLALEHSEAQNDVDYYAEVFTTYYVGLIGEDDLIEKLIE